MIKRVKLVNFICHGETEIIFPEGLTVFIGRNGSGKSSVIDGITYALYGKHTRGGRRNIVRDGSSNGAVEVELEFKGSNYKVTRTFNVKGELEAATLRKDGELLVVGEKRTEENVSNMVQKILGMNYDRIKTAIMIQQGELDRILSADPKELKQLFDDLMGLTSMEKAYEKMYDILRDYEKRVANEVGRSIHEVEKIDEELREAENRVKTLMKDLREYEYSWEERFRSLENSTKKLGEEVVQRIERVSEKNKILEEGLTKLSETVEELRRQNIILTIISLTAISIALAEIAVVSALFKRRGSQNG